MRVIFRVDASIEMGTGHVMRCLTLANELSDKGAEITFITRKHNGNIDDAITKGGHKIFSLSVPTDTYQEREDDVAHASWLGVPWEQDARETGNAIGTSRPDWLIMDHYGIDARWHKELRNQAEQIMVIDDLADRPLDCDMLLDQTIGRKEEDYRQWVPLSCRMMLGSRYALLRPRFAELRPRAIEKRKNFNGINRILVSMGGVDAENVTATVLSGISKINWKHEPTIDVVMGGKAPHLDEVIALAEDLRLATSVSIDISDMEERMLDADLAFGTGGTTSWERCCLGLPALLVISAENQKTVSNVLKEAGAVRVLGIGLDIYEVDIKQIVEEIIYSPDHLLIMSQAGFRVTDGLGAKRIALAVIPPFSKDGQPVRLRSVTLADTDLLFDWQSDHKTRRYAHNPEKPTYEEHSTWVRNRVEKTDAYTEIIVHGGEPAGVIRLDPIETGGYLISIYVAPDKYLLGIGRSALTCVMQLLPNTELRAEIHEDNRASKALFSSVGFTQIGNGIYAKNVSN